MFLKFLDKINLTITYYIVAVPEPRDLENFYEQALEDILELATSVEQHSQLEYSSNLETVNLTLTDKEAEDTIQNKIDNIEETYKNLRRNREKLRTNSEEDMWWESKAGNGCSPTGYKPVATEVTEAQHLRLEEEIEKITQEIDENLETSIEPLKKSETRDLEKYLREKERITTAKLNDIKHLRNYQRSLLNKLSEDTDNHTLDLFIDEDEEFLEPEELENYVPEDPEEIRKQVKKASETMFEIWRLYRDEIEEIENKVEELNNPEKSVKEKYDTIQKDWESVTGTLRSMSDGKTDYLEPLEDMDRAI